MFSFIPLFVGVTRNTPFCRRHKKDPLPVTNNPLQKHYRLFLPALAVKYRSGYACYVRIFLFVACAVRVPACFRSPLAVGASAMDDFSLDVPDVEWALWRHRKMVQRDLCGPKVPENPLVRLMAEALGVTAAETDRPADPNTARQAIRNTRARFLRNAAALMRLVKRDAEAQEFDHAANRFTRSLVKRPRARLQMVSAHWDSLGDPPKAA